MKQKEVILEVGEEGGSLCISRDLRANTQLSYRVIRDETMINEFLRDEDQIPSVELSDSSSFATLNAAFQSIRKYPWHEFHVLTFNEHYRDQILQEVLRNGGKKAKKDWKMKIIKPEVSKQATTSILDGVESIINKHLLGTAVGSVSYRHLKSARAFGNTAQVIDAEGLLSELLAKIKSNLAGASHRSMSNQNWRQDVKPTISSKNESKEVLLERNFAQRISTNEKPPCWWNQMPVASGLVGPNADRRRAIDLVHRDSKSEVFDFIELKIASDTPLYALMEIVLYGLIYLALREAPDFLSETSKKSPVLQARKINLRVLAPKAYFSGFQFFSFQQHLNAGFEKLLAKEKDGLAMSIGSYWHPELDRWEDGKPKSLDGLDSLFAIETWKPAFYAG